MYNGNVQQNPLCVESCVNEKFSMLPRFSPAFFYPDENSVLIPAHRCTAVVDYMRRKPCVRNCSRKLEGLYNGNAQQKLFMRSILRCKFSTPSSTSLYKGISTLYAQNPVFEIVHDESVKLYPHMYNGNVQQNPLCVESCVTKEFSMSPRFSSTIFYPDANSVL